MQAVGVSGFVVNGAEASALDVVKIDDREVSWTVSPAGGPLSETITSADPAVIAFVRRVICSRTMPDPGLPTSATAQPA